tara:strand:+ start:2758 stop:3048 length:291 start_codon:yes stop_codon:yes gene_type:complete
MAAITPTLGTINPVGDHTVVTGSFTGVDNDSHIALVPTTGSVLAFSMSTPATEATTPLVILNAITGGAVNTTQGSVRVDQTTTGIYTFIAHLQGAI